jgi:diaminopimelate epimerase
MNVSFIKGQGTGNDFVLVHDPNAELNLTDSEIRDICDRHFGIGADGVIIATHTSASSEVSHLLSEEPNATWFMDYRNADGSKGEMCGNGARVFARYLLDGGHAQLSDGSTLPIATRAGIKDITATVNGFAVDLGRWKIKNEEVLVHAAGLGVPRPGLYLTIGNPHVVVTLASVEELNALDLNKAPVLEPNLPSGANVEFVVLDDPLISEGVAGLTMRVHERGVGETQSCGTGIAAAAIAIREYAGNTQNYWRVRVPGGQVAVRMFTTEDGEHAGISGPAELSFSGSWPRS